MTSVTSAIWASAALRCCSFGELDDGVGSIVKQPLETSQLALGVLTDPVRDLDILALDDRPHASPPRCHPGVRATRSDRAGGSADGPVPSIARTRSITVRVPPRLPRRRPRRCLERVGARSQRRAGRHDVVDEERPSGPRLPVWQRGHGHALGMHRPRSPRAGHARARTGPPSPGRARAPGRVAGRAGGHDRGDESGLVVAALALAFVRGPEQARRRSAPTPTRAQRRAMAAPSGMARRRSLAYFSWWRASRTGPANGAHHSSWRTGSGRSAGKPDRRAAGQVETRVEGRQAPGAQRLALATAAGARGRECEVKSCGTEPSERRHRPMMRRTAARPINCGCTADRRAARHWPLDGGSIRRSAGRGNRLRCPDSHQVPDHRPAPRDRADGKFENPGRSPDERHDPGPRAQANVDRQNGPQPSAVIRPADEHSVDRKAHEHHVDPVRAGQPQAGAIGQDSTDPSAP